MLKQADIGIGFGGDGTEMSKQASDVLTVRDDLVDFLQGLKFGRNFLDQIYGYIQLQLSYTIITLSIVFIGAIFSVEEPISAIQLIWTGFVINLGAVIAYAT